MSDEIEKSDTEIDENSSSETPENDSEKKSNRLTEEQWAEIRFAYETGQKNTTTLSKEYGVSPSAMSQHFRKNGTVKNSRKEELDRAVSDKTAEKIADTISKFAEKRIERIEETKEFHYSAAKIVSQQVMKTFSEARTNGVGLGAYANDLKALRTAAAALSIARQERYHILEADEHLDKEETPGFEIHDLSKQDVKDMRKAQQESDLDDLFEEEMESIAGEDDEVVET